MGRSVCICSNRPDDHSDKLAALHKDDQKNLKENEELKGWNTKKDGSGDMVTAETVVSEE